MLPVIKVEVEWLDLQAQLKAKIGTSIRGVVDATRMHDGEFIVVSRLLDGACTGWFVSISLVRELGVDKLAARLIRQFREATNKGSNT